MSGGKSKTCGKAVPLTIIPKSDGMFQAWRAEQTFKKKFEKLLDKPFYVGYNEYIK